MGISSRVLTFLALYWGAEFVGIHWPQILQGYPADKDGRYQVSWIMKWKQTQDPRWLSSHALGASISFFLWLLLLSDRVRYMSLTFHRWAGRFSLAIFIASSWETPMKAWNMAVANDFNRFLVMVLGILSLVYAIGAYLAIRQKRIALHRQLALRLVFCSAAFVIYGRLLLSLLAPFLDEMTAKTYAIPFCAVTTLVGMEFCIFKVEASYPGSAYRVLGIPFLGLSLQDEKVKKI